LGTGTVWVYWASVNATLADSSQPVTGAYRTCASNPRLLAAAKFPVKEYAQVLS
jgi:hypothetical protein